MSQERQEYKCNTCGATFANREELKEHNRKSHGM
ncbi:MAG: hypothetical protein HYY22_06485 [Thaumarchaeota archaeon]|nr:hypothetical protein [Nitrososphaerota archaeon]